MFPHLERSVLAEVANTFVRGNRDHVRIAHAAQGIVNEMNDGGRFCISPDHLARVFLSVVPHPAPFMPAIPSESGVYPMEILEATTALVQCSSTLEDARRNEREAKTLYADMFARMRAVDDPEENDPTLLGTFADDVAKTGQRAQSAQSNTDQRALMFQQVWHDWAVSHELQFREYLESVVRWNTECYNLFPAMIQKIYMSQRIKDVAGNLL